MNYFKQLKNKHNKIEDAYRDYIVSQTLLKVGVCSVNASELVTKGFEIQEKINGYLENLIVNKECSLKDNLNCSSNQELIKFFNNNMDSLEFIGIERSLFIDLITESYKVKLNSAASNMTWEKLENLMIEQNNNIPLLESSEVKDNLTSIVGKYGLVSINLGKCRATSASINGLDERLNQLSKVIGCAEKQLGCNKFNIALDTEEVTHAGFSIQHGDDQKIFINERLGSDAFAHEWFHSLDNMFAVHYGLSVDHASDSDKLVPLKRY